MGERPPKIQISPQEFSSKDRQFLTQENSNFDPNHLKKPHNLQIQLENLLENSSILPDFENISNSENRNFNEGFGENYGEFSIFGAK